MVRAPSWSAPGCVLASSADTATKCRLGRFRPGTACQTPAKALCLRAKRTSKAPAPLKVNAEQRRLGDCRPHRADLRISSDHGDQVDAGLTLFILRGF